MALHRTEIVDRCLMQFLRVSSAVFTCPVMCNKLLLPVSLVTQASYCGGWSFLFETRSGQPTHPLKSTHQVCRGRGALVSTAFHKETHFLVRSFPFYHLRLGIRLPLLKGKSFPWNNYIISDICEKTISNLAKFFTKYDKAGRRS